jgi:hypothetical protein
MQPTKQNLTLSPSLVPMRIFHMVTAEARTQLYIITLMTLNCPPVSLALVIQYDQYNSTTIDPVSKKRTFWDVNSCKIIGGLEC